MYSYQRYAELRDKKGVTDYAVSKATGVASATLSNWKSGNYTPKADKLKKVADYFEVTVDYLLSDDEPAAEEQETAEKGD